MSEFHVIPIGEGLVIPEFAFRLLMAAVLGFLMGVERAFRQKVASLRTFAIISVGSCLFTVLSIEAYSGVSSNAFDVTRIASGIVTGIGFVGGGVIFKTADRIEGITTGVMIWLAAGLGMACGFGQFGIALWSFFIYVGIFVVAAIAYRVISFIHLRILRTPIEQMRYAKPH